LEKKRVTYAAFHLLDDAQLWYHRLPGGPSTWEQFVLLIIARFRPQITLRGGSSACDTQDEDDKALYTDSSNTIIISSALSAGDYDCVVYDANGALHNSEGVSDSSIHVMDNDDDTLHKDDGGNFLYVGSSIWNQGSLDGDIGATAAGGAGKDDPKGGATILVAVASGNNSCLRSGAPS
jgi:hypothetical protein